MARDFVLRISRYDHDFFVDPEGASCASPIAAVSPPRVSCLLSRIREHSPCTQHSCIEITSGRLDMCLRTHVRQSWRTLLTVWTQHQLCAVVVEFVRSASQILHHAISATHSPRFSCHLSRHGNNHALLSASVFKEKVVACIYVLGHYYVVIPRVILGGRC